MSKKVALVTGAASGIGAAIATRFKQNGWLVASIDKNKANTDISIQANVANLIEIKDAVKEIENKLGPIDSAVSNAGHYEMKSIQEVDNASLIKKFLGKKALKLALNKIPLSCDNSLLNKIIYKIFDLIIYKKFRQALGGNMEMIICGSASLASDLERFYWNIGVKVYCGYGLTESSPVISANCPKYFKLATVGKPFPSVKVKIADDKELLASGSNIMHSYHNLREETALTIVDNYLKTGDLAEIDNEGFIKIIGRKKELFKTSYGKYVYPVLIEQKLIQELGFLLGAVVIAQNRQFVSALLFPDFEIIDKFKEKFNFKEDNHNFLQSQILLDFIESKIELINSKLDNWQQIKKFTVILKPISIASQEITPSMKIRRNIIEEKFVEEINKLYQTS